MMETSKDRFRLSAHEIMEEKSMKKRFFAVISALLIFMLPVLCFAEEGSAEEEKETLTSGDWEYRLNDDGTATISRWIGEKGTLEDKQTLEIPEELDGLAVTRIGEYAFDNCYNLTEIIIPESVTEIGNRAFCGSGLTSITIPKSVTKIGEWPFDTCTYLANITVEPENESFSAEDNVLFENRSKTLICYPSGLTGTTYAVPEGTAKIGDYAFTYCSDLTGISIPDSVTEIGEGGFYSCHNLTDLVIPDSVTKIGQEAFYACTGLTAIAIPESVTKIEASTFANCIALKDVTIPESVTEIGNYAFQFCDNLTDITIPESVTRIGNMAFCASGLNSITIPAPVTEIGNWAFGSCHSLTEIVVQPENEAYAAIDNVLFDKRTKTLVLYPEGLADPVYIIPDGILKIGNNAFAYCSKLTGVMIPESVTEIGERAFSSCRSLTDITIPESVTKIGKFAFNSCQGLTGMTLPKSVAEIGNQAFDGCKNLTLTALKDSYAAQYAEENELPYTTADTDANDWLND